MNIWKQVLTRVEQSTDRTEYVNWFAPSRFTAQRGEVLEVAVPSQRFVDEIRERYGQLIRSILSELSAERMEVHLVVDPTLYRLRTATGMARAWLRGLRRMRP